MPTFVGRPQTPFRTAPYKGAWQVAPGGPPAQQNDGGGDGNSSGAYNNPYYDQLASLYRAQGAAEAASMRSSIQQMMIGMGLVPQGFKDQFGALDDTTKALIQKNTDTGISTYARLLEQKGMGIKDLINRLNSRGLRRSGARGYGLRKNQLAHDRQLSDVISQLLGQVGSMYGAYSQNEYARQAALIQAAMNYYANSSGSTSGVGNNNTSSSNGYTPTGGVITDYSNPGPAGGQGRVWEGWTPY